MSDVPLFGDSLLDFGKILEWVDDFLKRFFGEDVPPIVIAGVNTALAVLAALLAIWAVLFLFSHIRTLYLEHIRPLLYNQTERHRAARRRLFADHMEFRMRNLNSAEEWADHRYAELEGEVESEADHPFNLLSPRTWRPGPTWRREPTLSKALKSSSNQLVLLEGDPGSGKSVALRHVAYEMARDAGKARTSSSRIGFYINLKELQRQPEEAIDSNLIRSFVFETINRSNNRDVDEFLESEFDRGLREGTWLFLFDSFDEAPDVLSSTEQDNAVRELSQALADFVTVMTKCRAVVASRHFRGPSQMAWAKFRILPLSSQRQAALARRSGMRGDAIAGFTSDLAAAPESIRSFASNPMFLSLLCETVRSGKSFPKHAHQVFDGYLTHRLEKDEERLNRRFLLTPHDLRKAAETAAFCMAADPSLGLNPATELLLSSAEKQPWADTERFYDKLTALEFIKLGRSDQSAADSTTATFSFAHRRFQEYFATCIVLSESTLVSPNKLLTDPRWRETAVVLCQTKGEAQLKPILEAATILLARYEQQIRDKQTAAFNPEFEWPLGCRHLLSLLQEAFSNRIALLPDEVRMSAARIVTSSWSSGTLYDQKWALEVAGIVPEEVLTTMLRGAFNSDSMWLKNMGYLMASKLPKLPADIRSDILSTLAKQSLSNEFASRRTELIAFLRRLYEPQVFVDGVKLLRLAPYWDLALLTVYFFSTLRFSDRPPEYVLGSFAGGFAAVIATWHLYDIYPVATRAFWPTVFFARMTLLGMGGMIQMIGMSPEMLDQQPIHSGDGSWVPLLSLLMFIVYAPSLLSWVAQGFHVPTWMRPAVHLIAPIAIVNALINQPKKSGTRFWAWLWRLFRLYYPALLTPLLATGAMALLVRFIGVGFLFWFFALMPLILIIVALVIGVRWFLNLRHRRRALVRPSTVADLLNAMSGFSESVFAERYVHSVRKERSIEPTPGNLQDLRRAITSPSDAATPSEALYAAGVRDALCRLLEDLSGASTPSTTAQVAEN